ncbi:histidine phosphatase family protein [Hahella sp. CCB-MM4]|uniref:histidine phosphatase family protein n=1 Tax=Hahella sp. (strain CCB-MM4) TaxID=1926491 RepID=UPI000B9C752B|nr:histidine phosphatase family protein [Hahella sp. CCB-MM4]OZG74558.1 histidine phosphatase family protein [Hahella sp. CCB-MM4]
MGAVYLIRHGQASFGSSNYDRLSDTGRLQAAHCGRYLAAKGLRIDHWFSGTLERQRDTARLALDAIDSGSVEVIEDSGFNEFDHQAVMANILPVLSHEPEISAFINGEIDRKRHFQRVFERVVDTWVSQDQWEAMESWNDVVERVSGAAERVIEMAGSSKNIAVVTSGGPIAGMLASVLQLSPLAAIQLNWSIANTSITKIFYSGSRRSVGYFNHYAYLQQGADRSLVTYR